ncbi:MAG: aminotransferase class III-fold pyridoxal phosphate-dependent enzyme [Phycisphaerales bacterium]|nr:MAG: aminotransferase class III-fold pyridoxal phosphate-dependent enzyme [Phycisphaerales bacterium]
MLGIKQEQGPDQPDRRWIGPAPWIETPAPGPKAKLAIQQRALIAGAGSQPRYPLAVKRGFGTVIEDVDGNRFLDFAAGCAVGASGHSHPKVVAAIEAQSRALIHACEGNYVFPPGVELMEKLLTLAPGERLDRVHLNGSRSAAVQTALRLAAGASTQNRVIVLYDAMCEGIGARSTCGWLAPGSPDFADAPDLHVEYIRYEQLQDLEMRLASRRSSDPDDIAAVCIDPTQSLWGVEESEPAMLARLRKTCDEHAVYLICDETRSAVGQTGKWFACEHFGVVPDLIIASGGLAGGMPLAAIIGPDSVLNTLQRTNPVSDCPSPVSCAAALATLEVVEAGYMKNTVRLGQLLLARLREVSAKRKAIANVRGVGLACGVDVVSRGTGKIDAKRYERILQACFERGLILSGGGVGRIRFCPPLCINEAQLDVGLKIFDESVATVL